MAYACDPGDGRAPSVLTVPGLGGSGPAHWQTIWEAERADTTRADLGMWEAPRRNAWVTRLDQEIRAARAPVVLVAHSLGCLAVAWWAALAGQGWGWPVAGALLVAPPDPAQRGACAAILEFGPAPAIMLPFPAIVVASQDDPYATLQRVSDMAQGWGAALEVAGALGHINVESGLGGWADGRRLLDRVIGDVGRSVPAKPPALGADACAQAGAHAG